MQPGDDERLREDAWTRGRRTRLASRPTRIRRRPPARPATRPDAAPAVAKHEQAAAAAAHHSGEKARDDAGRADVALPPPSGTSAPTYSSSTSRPTGQCQRRSRCLYGGASPNCWLTPSAGEGRRCTRRSPAAPGARSSGCPPTAASPRSTPTSARRSRCGSATPSPPAANPRRVRRRPYSTASRALAAAHGRAARSH